MKKRTLVIALSLVAALSLAAAALASAPMTSFAQEVVTTGVNAPSSEVPVTLKVVENVALFSVEETAAEYVIEYEPKLRP